MTTKTTITAALVAIVFFASVAHTLEGWNAPIIATGQTALPLGAPSWML